MDLGIVDPQVLMRKALCALLADTRDLRVVLDVDHVFESFHLIQQLHPDALLIHSPNPANELATIPQIKKLLPQVKLVLLTDDVDDERAPRSPSVGGGLTSHPLDDVVLIRYYILSEYDEERRRFPN